jgi:SAM-dependent MidA family methyltransferase
MAQPPDGQTRFVGTLHCDGGFTFGDPTNPQFVTGTQGDPDQGFVQQDSLGAVKQMPAMADLTAAPTEVDFNALLAALRAAGLMAT